jgi:hypothetical protein
MHIATTRWAAVTRQQLGEMTGYGALMNSAARGQAEIQVMQAQAKLTNAQAA